MAARDPLDILNKTAEAGANTIIEFAASSGATIKKIPTRGHFHWTITSTKADAGAATAILKGTNNPDPASADGETLITNTHGGSDQEDGSSLLPKAYAYVFVALSAGTFGAGSIRVRGSGFP